MMARRKIRLCAEGLMPLEESGLRRVAETLPEFLREDEEGTEDYISLRIVAAERFLSRLDYYMPRKGNIILFLRDEAPADAQFPCRTICRTDNEQSIKSCIAESLMALECEEQPQGALSARETEVLREIASGKTLKEIADKLCISFNTVATHRKNISAKLGIKSVSGLSLYAVMNGLI